ncbi:DUF2357 domain-containing protein [Paenibacillus amylolyticus]|uniref:DUF2357 domain-containing protein n=1 Tax=Paenibacillus amylolyticus TaxID=1451 RepID=A0A117I2F8_PAEAM|nr:DUF2357 domain-containing protein [Paenibacillus amylolyticus]GAS83749.1 unknown protein [Paenibacillus amylolyticus]
MINIKRLLIKWPNSFYELEIDFLNGKEGERVSVPLDYVYNAITEKDDKSIGYSPAIGIRLDKEGVYYPIQLRENTNYFISVTIPFTFELEAKLIDYLNGFPFTNLRLSSNFKVSPIKTWKEDIRDNQKFIIITGSLQTKNQVGILDLSLGERENLFCEVASSKINYQEDFQLLLTDIAKESTEILLQMGNLTGLNLDVQNEREADYLIMMFHLRSLFNADELPLALSTVLNNMHSKIVNENEIVDISLVKQPNIHKMASQGTTLPFNKGGVLASLFNGYTPIKMFETNKYETVDTPENRYIKHFLTEVESLCKKLFIQLQGKASKEKTNEIVFNSNLKELDGWLNIIHQYLSEPIWNQIQQLNHIPSNSQVLQKRKGYRQILQYDLRLQLGLKLAWHPSMVLEQTLADVRPIYELYEIWCFIKLRKICIDIFGAEKENTIIKVEKDLFSINLKKGRESKVVFKKNYEDKVVTATLFYNKEFQKHSYKSEMSYSLALKPDCSIKLVLDNKEGSVETFIHFDAKYRIDFFESNNKLISKNEDIIKMHAYKDAIRGSSGAYVLYPGTEESLYFQFHNRAIPSVGAFPLRTDNDIDLERIKCFIEKIIDEIETNQKC